MSFIEVGDPENVALPPEAVQALGLKNGDTVSVTVVGEKVILEKRKPSILDETFGMWADRVPDSIEYVNKIRQEWEDRAARLGIE